VPRLLYPGTHFDDGHVMSFNGKFKCGVDGEVDDPETVSLSGKNVDARVVNCRAPHEASTTIDESSVRNLRDHRLSQSISRTMRQKH
jgi:hypothetical protein